MAVTAPTDVSAWIPSIISPKSYDTTFASRRTLSADAAVYGDLEGEAGESFLIPTVGLTAPATNLAVTTAAVDEKLTGGGVPVVVKESVKSIAFFDRVKWATGTDFNSLAGSRAGTSQADRIELDLGATLVAGGTPGGEVLSAFNTSVLREMRSALPSSLRGGVDGTEKPRVYADDDVLSLLFADPVVNSASAFGSDEAIRDGDFVRPVAGCRLRTLDDSVLPLPTTSGRRYVAIAAPGMLIRAMQKAPSSEPERDARARLTRIVSSQLHAEGVVDPRGIIVFELNFAAAQTAANGS